MTEYRVLRQKTTHRDFPASPLQPHPQMTTPEQFVFQDLPNARIAFCEYVLMGYELVRIDRDYNSGVCGSVAVYNKVMDEYT